MHIKANYTPQIVEFLKENYPTKGGFYCAEYLGYPFKKENIQAYCSLHKIKMIDPYDGPVINMEDFLHVTDPTIAYLLGFYWADGHLIKKGIVSRNVKDDADLIYEMIKNVGKVITIDYDSICGWRPTRSICIFHRILADHLKSLDYGEKSKSSPTKILEIMEKDVQRFFWLGFLDGDGCFYSGNNNCYLSFTGSLEQDWSDLINFIEEMNCKYHLFRNNGKNGHKFSTVSVSSPYDIAQLGAFLYKTHDLDGLGLPRKYQKYLKIKETGVTHVESIVGLKGVNRRKLVHSESYYIVLSINHQTLRVSGFPSAEEAAIFYDKVYVQYAGHKAKTNYPIENYMELGVPNYTKPVFFDPSELNWKQSNYSLKKGRESLLSG
jgi:hypothetical protein